MTIERVPVQSSSLAAIGYSTTERVLEAEFKSGELYRFYMVPATVYEELLAAPSKGTFFNTRIKDRFPVVRVEHDAPDHLLEDLTSSLAAFQKRDP